MIRVSGSPLEKKLGVSLPADYRTLLLTSNGGVVDERNEFFPLGDMRSRAVFDEGFLLDTFFPAKDTEYPDGELWNVIECFRGRIPAHTIPVAENGCGDLILLGIKGRDIGVVYAWDHEHEGLAGTQRTFENIFELSRSFSGFVDSLSAMPRGK
jgi:hypothetical protein